MRISGDVLLKGDLIDPTSGRMYQILRRVQHMVGKFGSLSLQENADDTFILKTLLEERANDVIKTVSESNWTFTCILTMGKFRSICKASVAAVISYLSGCQKEQYFSIRKNDFIEISTVYANWNFADNEASSREVCRRGGGVLRRSFATCSSTFTIFFSIFPYKQSIPMKTSK